MRDKIQVTATMKIHDGKLSEFKDLAAKCLASVKEKDKGTLQYDWFFTSDEQVCVVREAYTDSDAVMAHMGNLGDQLGALLGIVDMTLDVFGEPSPALADALAPIGANVYRPFQGL